MIALAGCSLNLNDAPQAPEPAIGLSMVEARCLEGVTQAAKEYFNGSIDSTKVESFWNCARSSIRLFMEQTRGKESGKYTPEELSRFMERYILGGERIPDGLLREVMEVKRVLFGGDSVSLTTAELTLILNLMEVVKQASLELLPYMPVTPDHLNTLSVDEFEYAVNVMDQNNRKIAETIQGAAGNYSTERLKSFLLELEQLYGGNDPEFGPRFLREHLGFLGSLKRVILGTPADVIGAEDWKDLLVVGNQWHALYLSAEHLKHNSESWVSGEGLKRFVKLLGRGHDLIKDAVESHPEGRIPIGLLEALIDSIPSRESGSSWLPVSPAVSKDMVRLLLNRLLRSELGTTIENRPDSGLDHRALDLAWREVSRWAQGQLYLDGLFQSLSGLHGESSLGHTPEELLRAPMGEVLNWAFADGVWKDWETSALGSVDSISDLQDFISSVRPLFQADDNRVFFGTHISDRRSSFHHLTNMNVMITLSRLLMNGYAEDTQRVDGMLGVTAVELNTFCHDIRNFGLELKLLDLRKQDVGLQRFMEGNLFTYNANGDRFLGLKEGVELLSFLVSSNLHSHLIHSEIEGKCSTSPSKIWSRPDVDVTCYRDNFLGSFERYMDHMPGLAAHVRGLSSSERVEFARSLENAGRWFGASGHPMELGDTEAFVMLFHYLEALFVRYDIDQSGTINIEELRLAFPVFRRKLAEITGFDDDARLWPIFTYMLKFGVPPEETLQGGLSFWFWREREMLWKVEADRGRVLEVIGAVARGHSN